jgi:ABC-type Fe3+-siderophore transport system permease subunit
LGILALPCGLLVADLRGFTKDRLGKLAYLGSITALYGLLLLSVRDGHRWAVQSLTVASAAFHAVEYMAIVTYYAQRRQEHGSAAAFRSMAAHWLQILAAFVIVLGLIGQHGQRHWTELWYGLNLWCAFLHYAYDGMIWKLRRAETASTLGVQVTSTSGTQPT